MAKHEVNKEGGTGKIRTHIYRSQNGSAYHQLYHNLPQQVSLAPFPPVHASMTIQLFP
jgi:hypothetical protein